MGYLSCRHGSYPDTTRDLRHRGTVEIGNPRMQADVTKRFDTQLAFFGKTILSATGDLFKHTYTWLGRSVPPGRADIVRKGSHSKRLAN